MTVDDRTRRDLHRELVAVLGPEEAGTLMAHLPSVTWNDVATKADVRELERWLRSEMHVGIADLRTEMVNGTNRLISWTATFVAAGSSLLLGAVAWFR